MPARVLNEFLAGLAARFRNESLVSPEPSLMPSGPTYGTSPRPTCAARQEDARAAGRGHATEVDGLRVERLGGGHDRDVVLGRLGAASCLTTVPPRDLKSASKASATPFPKVSVSSMM
jgi:hypothetical protein